MVKRPAEDDPGPTSRAIEVDLAGLRDLANTVRQENWATLEPQSNLVRSELSNGVCFGARSASGSVLEAKQRYQDSLQRAMEQMYAHVRAASILADTADRVVQNYANTDALARARSQEVERALTEAIIAADRVVGPHLSAQ
ncbi:hypothetical protein [Rhizomonospora bruguierae]|uniref:hypothetical protein n=1 Tax=Rhizomonospora bruguierae TaxID=1581705 RepID=UPI001BD1B5FA|nr:hypothetical protein [Micromonospora sp. NBRC 107566]